jgi:hypothetical protein
VQHKQQEQQRVQR